MLTSSIPVIRVSQAAPAERFYVDSLGFTKRWEYRPSGPGTDPAYMGMQRDGVWLHVTSFSGDGVSGTAVFLWVSDVDALFAEFTQRGVAIELKPCNQPWNNREMYIRDPDENCLRFAQSLS